MLIFIGKMGYNQAINRVRDLGHMLFEISQDPKIGVCEKLKSCLFAQASFYRANREVVKIYISERNNIDAVAMII
jgi:hypothetical protein